MKQTNELEILVPIFIDGYWGDSEEFIASKIIELYTKYGLKCFSLAAPSNGQMNLGVATREYYIDKAHKFNRIKELVSDYPIKCGWWIANTLHTGVNPGCRNYVDIDGVESLQTTCPLDENFIRNFSTNIAEFAKIAKPAYIILEDDFNTVTGCFCKVHLDEFAKQTGKYYSREELKEFNNTPTPDTIDILRTWRAFSKNVMVSFAKTIRAEVDKETPEIPIGTHQPGCSDFEGFSSEEIARALAGTNHTPFSRIYSMQYCCYELEQMPEIHFHALYCKQHFNSDFKFMHESDTYPHSKFFCSANKMNTMMSIGYSYGFDGSMFWALSVFGKPDDELSYCKMYAKEQKRFNKISSMAKKCKVKGPKLCYDPFYYTIGNVTGEFWNPLWTRVLGNFGIPYTTDESNVIFWDKTNAKYADDTTIMQCLSKGIFLDGEAAKILCDRGYEKYLGAKIGDTVSTGICDFDQCSYEMIKDGFVENIGNTMAGARSWCPTGNGSLLSIIPTSPQCEVVTEAYNISNNFIAVAMTRFENSLGGRVVIMGTTLENNRSQCLYNYPRQMLIQNLIKWCSDEYVFIRNSANVFCIMNECTTDEFTGMITIVNLCTDDYENPHIYLPPSWRSCKDFYYIDLSGEMVPIEYSNTAEGIIINKDIRSVNSLCIIAK